LLSSTLSTWSRVAVLAPAVADDRTFAPEASRVRGRRFLDSLQLAALCNCDWRHKSSVRKRIGLRVSQRDKFGLLCSFSDQSIEVFGNTDAQKATA
jgi:hypothetical protein